MRVCKKMCNECPFAKTSLRGYLGGFTPEETLATMQMEGSFACHLHRTDDTTVKDILGGDIPICRGFMLSAKKSCKMFGQGTHPDSILLSRLQKTMEIKDGELDNVLAKWEFTKHHTI